MQKKRKFRNFRGYGFVRDGKRDAYARIKNGVLYRYRTSLKYPRPNRFQFEIRLKYITFDLFMANLPFFIFGGQFVGFERNILELYFVVKQVIFVWCLFSSFYLRYRFHYRRFGFQWRYTFQSKENPYAMRRYLAIYRKQHLINQACYYFSYIIIIFFQFLMFGIPYFFYTDIGFIFTWMYGMYSTGHIVRIISFETIAQPFLDVFQHCYRYDYEEERIDVDVTYIFRDRVDNLENFIQFIQTFYFAGILLHYHLGRSMYIVHQLVNHQPSRRF